MGPQDSNDVSRDIARDLTGIVGELAALKGDAAHWLTSSEYAALKHRLEDAHAAVEAAPVRLAAFSDADKFSRKFVDSKSQPLVSHIRVTGVACAGGRTGREHA